MREGRNRFIVLIMLCMSVYGCGSRDDGNTDLNSLSSDTPVLSVKENTNSEDSSALSFPRNMVLYMLDDPVFEMGQELFPADFFDVERIEKEKAFDPELLSYLSFAEALNEEDLFCEGDHPIAIMAGDQVLTTNMIIKDTTPPLISIDGDKEYERGDTILYRSGVRVTDNSKETPELTIDSSEVQSNVPGVYPVFYQATDSAGNTGYAEGKIIIKEDHTPTEKEVDQIADDILKQLIETDMSEQEKAWAIYNWCLENIHVTARAQKDSILYGAYDGLYYKEGDCFTSFAAGMWLLERSGFRTIPLSHQMGESTHYWSLVELEEGWYHFDCSHLREGYHCFMQTDEQVKRFAERNPYFPDEFDFDQDNIPERGEKELYVDPLFQEEQ